MTVIDLLEGGAEAFTTRPALMPRPNQKIVSTRPPLFSRRAISSRVSGFVRRGQFRMRERPSPNRNSEVPHRPTETTLHGRIEPQGVHRQDRPVLVTHQKNSQADSAHGLADVADPVGVPSQP